MTRERFDLQLHSTWSDGYKSVNAVVALLKRHGVTTASLTDHNTVAGVEEFLSAARRRGIRPVPGTEIYASYRGRTLHVLGYNVDHTKPAFIRFLDELEQRRRADVARCVDTLAERGFRIDMTPFHVAKTKYIGLAFIVSVLQRSAHNRRLIKLHTKIPRPKLHHVLHHYFFRDGGIHLPETTAPIATVIRHIRGAGGTAVLAHPGAQMMNEEANNIIPRLKKLGVRGIEVLSPYHNWHQIEYFQDCAFENRLFMTMGSDYHGDLVTPNGKHAAVADAIEYYHSPATFIPQMKKGLGL